MEKGLILLNAVLYGELHGIMKTNDAGYDDAGRYIRGEGIRAQKKMNDLSRADKHRGLYS